MANEIVVANDNAMSMNYGDGYFCTVDVNTDAGQNTVLVALNGATPLKDLGDKPFLMLDIIQEAGTRAVSGTPCVNTYLVSEKNKVYFTQSDGIARSALRFAKFKPHAFAGGDGVMVKVIEMPTKSGTMKCLVPAE